MNMDLKNKVAFVTGGANGIGRSISLSLAKAGCKVVINYHKSEKLALSLLEEIKSFGGEAIIIQGNISSFKESENMITKAVEAYGTINILVNNAGITSDGLILRMNEEQFDQVIQTNLKGVWNMCKHVSKIMLKSGYGRIINISSVSGILGNAGQTNYSAAKAGVIGLTKALAREFASRGVTVNAIAPGFIETDMTDKLPKEAMDYWFNQIPLKRIGKPEEIASAVKFLASEESSYITGHTLTVDGGLAM